MNARTWLAKEMISKPKFIQLVALIAFNLAPVSYKSTLNFQSQISSPRDAAVKSVGSQILAKLNRSQYAKIFPGKDK